MMRRARGFHQNQTVLRDLNPFFESNSIAVIVNPRLRFRLHASLAPCYNPRFL